MIAGRKRIAAGGLFLGFLLHAGCGGPSLQAYCDRLCSCAECTVQETDKCLQDAVDAKATAEKGECSGEFDEALSCTLTHSTCTNRRLAFGDDCARPIAIFEACLATAKGLDNRCEQATTFVETCFEKVDPAPDAECAPLAACQATCVLRTTCAALNGEDQGEAQQVANCIAICGSESSDDPPPSPGRH